MIANDKICQIPARFDNVIENIFKIVCGMNFHKGNKFFLQHTTQQKSNLLDDVNLWYPLV